MSIISTCEYCGVEFIAERSTAKFCCDSHKTLACRDRKHQQEVSALKQHFIVLAELREKEIEEFHKNAKKEGLIDNAEQNIPNAKDQKARNIPRRGYKKGDHKRNAERLVNKIINKTGENDKTNLVIGLGLCAGIGVALYHTYKSTKSLGNAGISETEINVHSDDSGNAKKSELPNKTTTSVDEGSNQPDDIQEDKNKMKVK
jgi:hypothetical protein